MQIRHENGLWYTSAGIGYPTARSAENAERVNDLARRYGFTREICVMMVEVRMTLTRDLLTPVARVNPPVERSEP